MIMTNDRRTFIKQSATVAAAVSIFPTIMNAGCVGANEKVVVALIGCCLLYTSPSPRDRGNHLVCRLLLEKIFF